MSIDLTTERNAFIDRRFGKSRGGSSLEDASAEFRAYQPARTD
jgi:hypothetical protein